jgi:cytidyltransferase-like protein
MKLDDDKKLHNDVIDERLSFTTEGGSTVTKRTTLTTGLAFDISNSRDPHAYNNGRNGFLPTFAEDPDPNLSLDIAIQRPKPTSFAGSVRFVEVGETSDSRNVPPIGKLNESYSALGQVHVAEESKWTFGLPDVSSMVPVDFGIEKSLSSFSNMMASRATEPRRGVMVGKFWPLHKGHEYLLGKALCHCDELYIIVKVKPYELPRGRLRAGWVRAASPHAHVMIIEDVYDPEDAYLWAALLKEWCGFVPRVLFGSEKARAVACALGSECNHVMIDDMREVHPIAGLTIRSNPVASWEHLPPNVRGYYAERVVIVGAPCTGKSTVAQELAAHFDAPLVNDYAKELAEQNLVAQRKVGKHGTSFNWYGYTFVMMCRLM